MNELERQIEMIRRYHAAPKDERQRMSGKPNTSIRTRMIIKYQTKKYKTNE